MAYGDTTELKVKITGDNSGFNDMASKTKTSVQGLGQTLEGTKQKISTFGDTFKAILASELITKGVESIAELGHKLVEFSEDSVKAYETNQNALAQLDAVLKSTHGAAGLFRQDLIDQADALENLTPYSHGAILSVQNLLLTFTEVHGAIYQKAIPAILDVATAMHEDLQSASVQVGKALNDPATGMSMLHRIGVTFTKGQIEAATAMEKTGNMAGAQSIVLKELQKEFGGSAEAAGNTFAGKMAILNNKFDDFKENVGEAIVNYVEPFALSLLNWIDKMGGVNGIFEATIKTFTPFIASIVTIGRQVGDYLTPKIESLWKTINTNLVPILKDLWHNVIEPLIPVIGQLLVGAVGLVIDSLNIMIPIFTGFAKWVYDNKDFLLPIIGALAGLKGALALNDAFGAATVAFKTFQLVTIPQAAAEFEWFTGIVSTPMVMPAIAIGAALASIAAVMDAYNRMKAAMADAQQARTQAMQSQANTTVDLIREYNNTMATDPKKARIKSLLHSWGVPGYAEGGFTGVGGEHEVAGVVHKGEYVLPKSQVDQSSGLPKTATATSNVTLNVNVGMYAGMPVEKRQIALELYKELVRAARSQGVSLPMIGAVGVQ